jgi:soluble lytic murein transglycosylase
MLFRSPLFFCIIALLSSGVFASADKDFLKAREAIERGQYDRFEHAARHIPKDYPLTPYLAFWRLQGKQDPQSWLDFADLYADSPLAQRAREILILRAIDAGDWQAALTQARKLVAPSDEMLCLTRQAQWQLGQIRDSAKLIHSLATGHTQPRHCEALYQTLRTAGLIDDAALLNRLRLALEEGNLELAHKLDAWLPEAQRMHAQALTRAEQKPAALVREHDDTRAAQREVALYALYRLARQDPHAAASLWSQEANFYPMDARNHGWGVIAVGAARQHHPSAPDWFRRAGLPLTALQHTWRVRANLRAGNWAEVYQSILAMPTEQQNDTEWRYWKARALLALNARGAARALFAELAHGFGYYAQLSAEEMDERLQGLQGITQAAPLTDTELTAAETHSGLSRALLLRKMGLDSDARAEWNWATQDMDDRAILAAAERARRAAWYDRAILTATRTRENHSLDLRYITPYRDLSESYAQERGLDVAWVYGLMRQESRFIDYARSRVGAGGLMQIMPDTANWIARKIGASRKEARQMQKPDHNVRFGTWYLRHLYDGLDRSPVLATAAYNAGPSRARRWQAERELEGAIYVETIPFLETREYVKKVLTNAMFYTRRMSLPQVALKERLGHIPPRSAAPIPQDEKVPWIAPDASESSPDS